MPSDTAGGGDSNEKLDHGGADRIGPRGRRGARAGEEEAPSLPRTVDLPGEEAAPPIRAQRPASPGREPLHGGRRGGHGGGVPPGVHHHWHRSAPGRTVRGYRGGGHHPPP